MGTKAIKFINGKSEKRLPETISVTGVYEKDARIPHRVRDNYIELKTKITGEATVHFQKVILLKAATYLPLEST
jgi:hypothetical protein